MKNLFAYDFTTNTIVASKATLKKAGNPTTPEYKALMKMIAEQPTFKVVEKAINTKSGKTTYKGLTIEMMESYINAQENPVALCAEFESIRRFAKNSKRREYPRQARYGKGGWQGCQTRRRKARSQSVIKPTER